MVQAVGIAAFIITVIRTWPQVWRLRREHDAVLGISVVTWSVALSCHTGWIIYSGVEWIVPQLASNALTAIACVLVLAMALQNRKSEVRGALIIFGGLLAASLLLWRFVGIDSVGLLAALLAIGMFVPQAVRVRRTSTEGVSLLTWSLILLSTSLWGLYGLLISKWLLVLPTVAIAPTALIIILAVHHDSRSRDQRDVELPT